MHRLRKARHLSHWHQPPFAGSLDFFLEKQGDYFNIKHQISSKQSQVTFVIHQFLPVFKQVTHSFGLSYRIAKKKKSKCFQELEKNQALQVAWPVAIAMFCFTGWFLEWLFEDIRIEKARCWTSCLRAWPTRTPFSVEIITQSTIRALGMSIWKPISKIFGAI